jgi:DnaJ-class molecular chaperone
MQRQQGAYGSDAFEDLFSNLFGSSRSRQQQHPHQRGRNTGNPSTSGFGGTQQKERQRRGSESVFQEMRKAKNGAIPPIEQSIECSMEQIYHGAVKKFKIKDTMTINGGKVRCLLLSL